jgi:hypothetical protein
VLPIIPETEWLFKPTEATPLLFSHSGKPYTSKKLNRIWESANKKANIEYGVPILNVYNSLRHSFACQRLNQGFSLDKVSTVLGHTSTQMTKRYAQYTVDKLGDVIRGKREPVHSLFIAQKISKLSDLQGQMVGGTGIEPCPLTKICSIFNELKANPNQFTPRSHFSPEKLLEEPIRLVK